MFKTKISLMISFQFLFILFGPTGNLAFSSNSAGPAIELALNWKPEPEFGGFYEAQRLGLYEKAGMNIQIVPGGAGQPVAQMLAAKKVKFGVVAADEIILSQNRGANIVGIFAVYQDNPQGFMVHESAGITSLKELFQSPITIALQKGFPYSEWLLKTYAPIKAKVVPYTGGVALFLNDEKFSQQCFVTSEPLAAKKAGKKVKTFLLSDSGFNPYLAVIAVHQDTLKKDPEMVRKFVQASQMGWISYLKNPIKTNELMSKLNPSLDVTTMNEIAKAQERFVEHADSKKVQIGTMQLERWKRLYEQMIDLKIVRKGLEPALFFADFLNHSKTQKNK